MSGSSDDDFFSPLGAKVRRQAPLAPHTTLGIGGDAEWLITPASHADLCLALDLCRRHRVPWRVLGGGSNVLVADDGVPGVVVMLGGPDFESVTVTGTRVMAGASAKLAKLLQQAANRGLAGVEGLAGIPGTVGGAVVGNAGGRWGEMGAAVSAVVGYTGAGERRRRARAELGFGYRESTLGDLVVTDVEVELRPGVREKIREQMADIISERRMSQPLDARSAGCVFRNPPGHSAGELIDRAGLKGQRVGGAEVSPVHANFIVNRGPATAREVRELVRLIRSRVREKFAVELELEVRLWPEMEW